MEAKKARSKVYHQTSQQSYYMKPSAASLIKIVDPSCKVNEWPRREPPPRLGIVVMTKRPINFVHWLAYHWQIVGIVRFFVQCEDTPELARLLCYPPWSEHVETTFVAKTRRDYFVQMDRQATHIASAVPRARAAGIDWLLHVDDDELLYCPQGPGALWSALRSAPAAACDAHLHNLEALAPDASCSAPFASCTTFLVATSRYTSYTNGKSLGRVSRPGLRAHGPHHFRGDPNPRGESSTVDIPAAVAVVLHYESCTFERWCDKFRDLADRHGDDPDVVAKLPFPFYRESLNAMHKVAQAERALATAAAVEQLTQAAFLVWARRKVASHLKLAPHDTVDITVVADALATIFPPAPAPTVDPYYLGVSYGRYLPEDHLAYAAYDHVNARPSEACVPIATPRQHSHRHPRDDHLPRLPSS